MQTQERGPPSAAAEIIPLVGTPVVKIPEGVVVGLQNFAWAFNSQK